MRTNKSRLGVLVFAAFAIAAWAGTGTKQMGYGSSGGLGFDINETEGYFYSAGWSSSYFSIYTTNNTGTHFLATFILDIECTPGSHAYWADCDVFDYNPEKCSAPWADAWMDLGWGSGSASVDAYESGNMTLEYYTDANESGPSGSDYFTEKWNVPFYVNGSSSMVNKKAELTIWYGAM